MLVGNRLPFHFVFSKRVSHSIDCIGCPVSRLLSDFPPPLFRLPDSQTFDLPFFPFFTNNQLSFPLTNANPNSKNRDAVTPTQDWLMTPHPKVPRLFIAAGGSFHSWKLLPTIGAYVARMICEGFAEGSEEARRWAWDKVGKGRACPMYWPERDLGAL